MNNELLRRESLDALDSLSTCLTRLAEALIAASDADAVFRKKKLALETCELEFRYTYVWQTSMNDKGMVVLTSTNEKAREVEIAFALSQDTEWSALAADVETATEAARRAKLELDIARSAYSVNRDSVRLHTALLVAEKE